MRNFFWIAMVIVLTGCESTPEKVRPVYARNATFSEMAVPNQSDVAIIREGIQTHLWTGSSNVFAGSGRWTWVEYEEVSRLVEDPDYKIDSDSRPVVPVKVEYESHRVFFAFNVASLDRAAQKVIDGIPGLTTADRIYLDGYTDSIGGDNYNQKLGMRRADSVMKYLIKKGIDPSKINTVSHGERDPAESNKTAEGRKANRRVVIRLNLRDEGVQS